MHERWKEGRDPALHDYGIPSGIIIPVDKPFADQTAAFLSSNKCYALTEKSEK